MRTFLLPLYGLVALGVAGCASKTFAQEQAAASTKASEAGVSEIQKQVEATQTDVTSLKKADAAQNEQFAKLLDTARETTGTSQ
jgi:hypothetical protein